MALVAKGHLTFNYLPHQEKNLPSFFCSIYIFQVPESLKLLIEIDKIISFPNYFSMMEKAGSKYFSNHKCFEWFSKTPH